MIDTFNMAFINKKDWDYFLSIISDREKMPESWDDWYKNYMKLKLELVSHGFQVRDITIDFRDLINYCDERNIKIDGKARAQYVQSK